MLWRLFVLPNKKIEKKKKSILYSFPKLHECKSKMSMHLKKYDEIKSKT